jgi:hypothetical protein
MSILYDPTPIVVIVTACGMIMFTGLIQIFKTKILIDQHEILSMLIFAFMLVLDVYFVIVGLALLIYLELIQHEHADIARSLDVLMYEGSSLNFTQIAILNLTFYLGNFIILGFFIRYYYRMFWVNQIVFIYRALRKKVKELNESLMSNLPLIPVTPDLLDSICALCL